MVLFNRLSLLSRAFRANLSHHSPACSKDPVRVLVTGSAGQIGYSILPRLARGDVFGANKPVVLKMLDLQSQEKVMHGVRMELEDCAFPTLKEVQVMTDPAAAFKNTDVIVMLANSMVLTFGMPRSELLKENLKLYRETANHLKNASKDVKILMIANPANTNCLILIDAVKSVVPAKNLTCLTRLDHNRARWMVAEKLGVPCSHVRRVVVWGNHSHTMVPDLRFAEVMKNGQWTSVLKAINDDKWVTGVFIPTVRDRVNAIIGARGKSSSLSAANAGIDHLRNWLVGTDPEDWVSMGVMSDGSYSMIPNDLVFGQPCTAENGEYKIVKGLEIDENTKQMMEISAKELLEERKCVLNK